MRGNGAIRERGQRKGRSGGAFQEERKVSVRQVPRGRKDSMGEKTADLV